MFATFFLAIGALFSWMAFKGLSEQEIKGRGWGYGIRAYRRDGEPNQAGRAVRLRRR